jgi:tetratricopeptide (TPR) repeat protein
MDKRALALNPDLQRARNSIANMQMKIGNAELDIDPAQALKDFQLSLQLINALPQTEQAKVTNIRLRGITVRKIACAYSELGEYDQAEPLFRQALEIHQKLADSDPKDIRNLGDIKRALQTEAMNFEYAANPILAAPNQSNDAARRKNLLSEENVLVQYQTIMQQMLRLSPGDNPREVELGNVQVRLAAVRQQLHEPADPPPALRSALTLLRTAALKPDVSPMILDLVVSAFFAAQPESLRDPRFTLDSAERGVALTHRKTPAWLLSLAQAYRASGQSENARAAASEGMALLPPTAPGDPKSNLRKLLEQQASTKP